MDPNPVKDVASLLKRVRLQIEPKLIELGFTSEPTDTRRQKRFRQFYDYHRGQALVSISYFQHEAQLIADLIDDAGVYRSIAVVPMNQPRSTAEIHARCNLFATEVNGFLRTLATEAP